jgi:hypothetical protein
VTAANYPELMQAMRGSGNQFGKLRMLNVVLWSQLIDFRHRDSVYTSYAQNGNCKLNAYVCYTKRNVDIL